jgi:hypothetical protein
VCGPLPLTLKAAWVSAASQLVPLVC